MFSARASATYNRRMMRSTRATVLALVCAACAACSSSPPAPPAHATHATRAEPAAPTPTRDAGPPVSPTTSCPPAFGSTARCTPAPPRSVVEQQRTDVGQGPGSAERVASLEWPRCSYPEGTCRCQQGPTTCAGGAALRPPPPGWQPPPFRWVCTPAVRADGCPGVPPRAGDPCTVAHGCSYCITRYDCAHGRWSTPIVGPPPP